MRKHRRGEAQGVCVCVGGVIGKLGGGDDRKGGGGNDRKAYCIITFDHVPGLRGFPYRNTTEDLSVLLLS